LRAGALVSCAKAHDLDLGLLVAGGMNDNRRYEFAQRAFD